MSFLFLPLGIVFLVIVLLIVDFIIRIKNKANGKTLQHDEGENRIGSNLYNIDNNSHTDIINSYGHSDLSGNIHYKHDFD